MGTPIICQRRGKGSLTYKARSHAFLTKLKYPDLKDGVAIVEDIVTDKARGAPLLIVKLENKKHYVLACEGLSTKDTFELKQKQNPKQKPPAGTILPLSQIPEGMPVFNIEVRPNDGGKLIRGCGTFGLVVSRDKNKIIVKMPSKKQKSFDPNCRAIVGVVAGGKRTAKPLVKAGNKYHKMKAKSKKYPRISPTNMNARDHKYGGQNFGKQKTVSRNAPPGRKIGSIAARRSGKKR
ncbi:MAG: 50S ribosomal protein L2 [Candidatus Nanohalarchaeota archaeon]|nr:MAG: 50S ribosomal protein L2 [Candidatus Nanohaloarchaeota archaeon]